MLIKVLIRIIYRSATVLKVACIIFIIFSIASLYFAGENKSDDWSVFDQNYYFAKTIGSYWFLRVIAILTIAIIIEESVSEIIEEEKVKCTEIEDIKVKKDAEIDDLKVKFSNTISDLLSSLNEMVSEIKKKETDKQTPKDEKNRSHNFPVRSKLASNFWIELQYQNNLELEIISWNKKNPNRVILDYHPSKMSATYNGRNGYIGRDRNGVMVINDENGNTFGRFDK
jgi:hypothetical protein